LKLVRQLWYILTPKERMEGALLLCAMVLGALFETLSIGVIFPFIAILKEPELLSKSAYLRPFLPQHGLPEPRLLFLSLAIILIFLFAVKTGYLILLYRWLYRYAMTKHMNLSRQLLAGYLNAPYTLHVQRNSADLIRVTTRSVEDFATTFMVNLLIVLGEILVLGALASLLTIIEPLGMVGAVLVLGVPTALAYRLTQPGLASAGRAAEEGFAGMIQWAGQALSGVKEITITGRRAFFLDQHAYHVQRFSNSNRLLSFYATLPRFIIDTLSVIALITLAAVILARGQDLQSSLLLLGMFALAAVRMIPSTTRLSSALAQVRFRYAATDVIYRELLALRQRPSDHPPPKPAAENTAPLPFRQALTLEHVSFSYPGAHRPAIDDVSIVIPRGYWVGFIGPTGAGKTTLADLILGLLAPTSGKILLDEQNLDDNLAGWQRNIGYVPQTTYLIDDSVRRNVAYGVPEAEIDDGQVWLALRTAQVDHLVRSLPGELDAIVGERGGRLSGGERQRLGIARALYGDPEVLVIDEGTSNLDPATEAAIVEVVAGLRGKKTIIAIAHRPAFVRNCDCIFMLAQGRLRNSGRYSDLLARDRDFSEFCGVASVAVPVHAAASNLGA
jgi:ATP-binding cassette, subfamily B, bacterial PglK